MTEIFSLTNTKPVSTPIEPGKQLMTEQSPSTTTQITRMHGVPYAKAIGSVLWPTMISRPDAAYAVGVLVQFIQNLGQTHWEALKQVIVYLGATKDLWLTFGGRNQSLVNGFCNANWASQTHCHSISGYLFHMRSGAVTWSSKKQYIVALSSTESEYVVLSHAEKEALWLRAFISEIWGAKHKPVIINCDNQGAIALSKDNKFHV